MMKKLTALAATLLLTLGVLLLCTSCGVKELAVDTENLPQTVFVRGNELDLSSGALLADGTSISFTDPDVTVTGYDKDTVGKQTLTVSYKGAETTFDITVVPRFETAESYLYFVGEEMSAVGVRLRVTRDNGTTFSVSLGDEGVEVTGFTTEAETDALTLNIACRNEGVDYTGSFSVMVATPDINFKKPRKTSYGSHETAIDPTGATLTLKSADGKTTRNISSDELTFTGYDPARVGEGNLSESQTVKVLWHGREAGTFDVTVTYSDVSRVKAAATTLSEIDWSHYEYPAGGKMYIPEGVSDEDGKLAMRALEIYYSLTSKDADFILPAELDSIARLAVIYGYNEFYAAIARAYADVFTLALDDGSIYLTYTCDTIEEAREGLRKLTAAEDDDTKLIYRYGSLLKNGKLNEKCGETVIYDGAEMEGQPVSLAVGHMMTVLYDSSFFTKIEHVLEKMIAIPDLLDVPADWTVDTLADHKDAIEAVYTKFVEISLSDASDGGVYDIVNAWREKKDIFEILYRYYFGVMAQTDDAGAATEVAKEAAKKVSKLVDFRLPGRLEELRAAVLSATFVQAQLRSGVQYAQYGEFPPVMESAIFFSYYRQAANLLADLVEEGDEMYLTLYASVFAQSMLSLQVGNYGYYALWGTSAFDDDCLALMNRYLDLSDKYAENKAYIATAECMAGVDEMFRAFVALAPNEQRNFLSAVNYLYGTLNFMALYPSEDGLYSDFATFLYTVYVSALGIEPIEEEIDGEKVITYDDPSYDLFLDLMLATECYATGNYQNFVDAMVDAAEIYSGLAADKKAVFDEKLGFLYTDLLGKYATFTVTTEGEGEERKNTYLYNGTKLGDLSEEWQAVFSSLDGELNRIVTARFFIEDMASLTGQSVGMYLAYFASYERVLGYEKQILESGDDAVLSYYYHFMEKDGDFPRHDSVYDARGNYRRYLLLLNVDSEKYEAMTDLRSFLNRYADYFWYAASLMGAQDPLVAENPFFGADVDAAMLTAMFRDFRALSPEEKYLMLGLDTASLYYGGLQTYFASLWQTNTKLSGLVTYLFASEVAYFSYEVAPGETVEVNGVEMTTKEYALSVWNTFLMAYSLDSEEFARFTPYFGEMYEVYSGVFSALALEPDAEG